MISKSLKHCKHGNYKMVGKLGVFLPMSTEKKQKISIFGTTKERSVLKKVSFVYRDFIEKKCG